MHANIASLLHHYQDIPFTHPKDKELFLLFIESLSEKIKTSEQEQDLLDIIEYSFVAYSRFDPKVLYNPMDFVDALLEGNVSGYEIDADEFSEMIQQLSSFEQYLAWAIKTKVFLEKKYHINIVCIRKKTKFWESGIRGTGMQQLQIISAIKKIRKHLLRYPITFIRAIHLESICIAQSFYKEATYLPETQLWGFESVDDDNIYLAATNISHAFDHELYHQAMQYYDDTAERLAIRRGQNTNYLFEERHDIAPWFARNYGKENVPEDQATIAQELMLHYDSISERAQHDPLLLKKVNLVKKAYAKISDGLMDDAFWTKRKGLDL